MSDNKIFKAKGDSPEMIAAFEKAQKTFKYFWREISWEERRIVPALDFACVKVVFSQEMGRNTEPIVEHMWINDISFDVAAISWRPAIGSNNVVKGKSFFTMSC